jgi:predicted Co/Zn/Cd cation transporter (cation efflux family)
MKRWLKNNSLSLVVFVLFLLFWFGQSVTGYQHYNE